MTPLPPESVFFTIQSGWPADGVMFATVASINGLKIQESSIANTNAVRLIHIHSTKSQPADAFVAIDYRRHWFWIDDRDLKSKRVFAFMMMLFTLADTGEKENLPLITIPAQ